LVFRSPQPVSFAFLFLHEQDELVVLSAAKWGAFPIVGMCSVQSVGRVSGVRFRQALRSRRSLACFARSRSFFIHSTLSPVSIIEACVAVLSAFYSRTKRRPSCTGTYQKTI
jgi:hypothetical protein